jgi:hypothetical protein
MTDPEDYQEKFNIYFDSKYKELFKDLDHPYLFVGSETTKHDENQRGVFVCGDLKQASMADIIMMRHALAVAFDNLIADMVTENATGYKRKNSEDMTISSTDKEANDRIILLTSSLALVYRVLSKLPTALNEEHKSYMLESLQEVVTDLEELNNILELPDAIEMKLALLVDGLRETNIDDKFAKALKVLAKELVDHYMERVTNDR